MKSLPTTIYLSTMMKYQVLDRIFRKPSTPRRFEYLEVDETFNIIDRSDRVQYFAYSPHHVILGRDVRLSFPEFIGIEDVLKDILTGQEDIFELPSITRSLPNSHNNLYIDIYIVGKQHENLHKNTLILLIEDVTEKMLLEQKLTQRIKETKLLSIALSTSKDYIEKIINSMADALIVTSEKGIIKKINRATQEVFGYSEKELIEQPINTIISEDKFLHQTSQQHYLFNKYLKDVEVICKNKNQDKLLISFSCSVVQRNKNSLKEYVYIGRDITDRQRSQQRQETQYAVSSILSEAGNVKEAIPKILQVICETLGWDVGELWTTDEYLKAAGLGYRINPVLRCVEIWSRNSITIPEFQAITWQTTYTPSVGLPGCIWSTRSPQWVKEIVAEENFGRSQSALAAGFQSAFGFPILGDGEILGVMTFLSQELQPPDEDLLSLMVLIGSQLAQFMKRKQAEAALLESEARYRDLFENANDLIQSVSPQGRFIYVNRAWRTTLGYSEAEIAKLNAFDIIHPDFKEHCKQIFYRVMSGEEVGEVKAAFLTKNGKKIYVEGNISCKIVGQTPVATRGIFRNITQRLIAEEALRQQQKQTELLLLNILPSAIVDRLKESHTSIAEDFADVTVLFADIVGFTEIASSLSAIQLVKLLNQIFSAFDRLTEKYGLEKIKTIGDAYMVVGGLPTRSTDHAHAIAQMALDMQAVVAAFNAQNNQHMSIRIGIHTGNVVAGVIGIKKFTYDLWGDTVNIASRMESQGLAGYIQVTETTYERLQNEFLWQKRGEIEVKGKGKMTTYLLMGRN